MLWELRSKTTQHCYGTAEVTGSKEIGKSVSPKSAHAQAKYPSTCTKLDGWVTKTEKRKKNQLWKELLKGAQFHNWEQTDYFLKEEIYFPFLICNSFPYFLPEGSSRPRISSTCVQLHTCASILSPAHHLALDHCMAPTLRKSSDSWFSLKG